MNELQVFKGEFGEIRTVVLNGEVWFAGKDVAKSLGYSNTQDALIKHVDDEDKQIIQKSQNATFEIPNRGLAIINESGMYSLVLSSKLESAKKFKRWITSEVIPSIRRHGMYATDELVNNPDLLIQVATQLKKEREERRKLEAENFVKDQLIGELKPKADYTDQILTSKSLVTITQIAKDYGMSGQSMNQLLHEYGVQFKQSGQWLLYSTHHDKGYTHSETVQYLDHLGFTQTKINTKWTQKGRLFIYELLKWKGILPLIEQ